MTREKIEELLEELQKMELIIASSNVNWTENIQEVRRIKGELLSRYDQLTMINEQCLQALQLVQAWAEGDDDDFDTFYINVYPGVKAAIHAAEEEK